MVHVPTRARSWLELVKVHFMATVILTIFHFVPKVHVKAPTAPNSEAYSELYGGLQYQLNTSRTTWQCKLAMAS